MNKSNIITAVAMLAVGAGIGYWFSERSDQGPAIVSQSAREPIFYRHPMDPSITSPVPAKGSMGMDYVPVYENDEAGGQYVARTVEIDPVVVQNIGVRGVSILMKSVWPVCIRRSRVGSSSCVLIRPAKMLQRIRYC